MRKNPKTILEAQKAIKRIRQLAMHTPSVFDGLTDNQAIEKMRKVREKLWEERFEVRPRHK